MYVFPSPDRYPGWMFLPLMGTVLILSDKPLLEVYRYRLPLGPNSPGPMSPEVHNFSHEALKGPRPFTRDSG